MRRKNPVRPEIESPGNVRITHHEGALVGAVELPVFGDPEKRKYLVRDTVTSLSCWTAEQGGLVGHIKASLQTPAGTVFFSCTGDAVHIREFPDTGEKLTFTAIVFFVEEEELRKRLEAFADKLQ